MSAVLVAGALLAVQDPFFIGAAWVVTFGVIALYSAWILRRGRRLSREVPEGRRRWM